jgi:hypothetical protein
MLVDVVPPVCKCRRPTWVWSPTIVPCGPGSRPIPGPTESSSPLPSGSPGKSHSKSQRGPSSGDMSRRRATVCAVQVLSEPCRATPGDAREVTGGQGVAGSNPAVPTQRTSPLITANVEVSGHIRAYGSIFSCPSPDVAGDHLGTTWR